MTEQRGTNQGINFTDQLKTPAAILVTTLLATLTAMGIGRYFMNRGTELSNSIVGYDSPLDLLGLFHSRDYTDMEKNYLRLFDIINSWDDYEFGYQKIDLRMATDNGTYMFDGSELAYSQNRFDYPIYNRVDLIRLESIDADMIEILLLNVGTSRQIEFSEARGSELLASLVNESSKVSSFNIGINIDYHTDQKESTINKMIVSFHLNLKLENGAYINMRLEPEKDMDIWSRGIDLSFANGSDDYARILNEILDLCELSEFSGLLLNNIIK